MRLGLPVGTSERTDGGGDGGKVKILFDAGVPHQLRKPLMKLGRGYRVETVQYHAWGEYANGDLVGMAEKNDFQVMITADKGLEHELDVTQSKVGIVVLSQMKKNLVMPHVRDIADAIDASRPGTVTWVSINPAPPE